MFAIALAIVKSFDYDLFGRVIQEACAPGQKCPSPAGLSQALSAAVLGGGSAAVNHLLRALGFRPPVEAPEAGPKPERDKAWVSIRVERARSVGPVEILREQMDATAAATSDALLEHDVFGRNRGFPACFRSDSMSRVGYGGRRG